MVAEDDRYIQLLIIRCKARVVVRASDSGAAALAPYYRRRRNRAVGYYAV
jgi:hypothetical protein